MCLLFRRNNRLRSNSLTGISFWMVFFSRAPRFPGTPSLSNTTTSSSYENGCWRSRCRHNWFLYLSGKTFDYTESLLGSDRSDEIRNASSPILKTLGHIAMRACRSARYRESRVRHTDGQLRFNPPINGKATRAYRRHVSVFRHHEIVKGFHGRRDGIPAFAIPIGVSSCRVRELPPGVPWV